MAELGFEVNKIDYTSFRRNYGSLMNAEQMKVEKQKIMVKEKEKKKKYDLEQDEQQAATMAAKFDSFALKPGASLSRPSLRLSVDNFNGTIISDMDDNQLSARPSWFNSKTPRNVS